MSTTPLDQRQRHQRRHQRLQSRASQHCCSFTFVLMLASCWLLSSSVVQAVLTEDDVIDKELTWAAMARKVHTPPCFYAGAPNDTKGSSKIRNNSTRDDDFDWTRDNYDWTQQQRQQDRIQLQLQQEEQPRQRPQQLRSRRRQRRNVEKPCHVANLRERSAAPLPR
jgi:hypothetical protein